MKFNFIVHKFKTSDFFRNVVTLMTGTGLSQIITIGATTILTRIYSPEQFGFYAIFMSVYGISGNPATGKYDKAILLPKNDNDSDLLTVSTVGLAMIYAILLLLIFLIFGRFISNKIGNAALFPWLFLIPLLVVLNSGVNCLIIWLNRRKAYSAIAKSRVIKSISTAVFNISLAYVLLNMGNLILGEFLGVTVVALFVFFVTKKYHFLKDIRISINRIKQLLVKYKDFPKYNIVSDLINVVSGQIPMLLITFYFGVSTAGFYSLTKRVLDAPVNLLSSAVMEVFRQKAIEEYNTHGHSRTTFKKVFNSLFFLAIGPSILIAISAPWLFEMAFGKEWRQAGIFASILTIMYFFKFIVSPLTFVYFIFEKQRENFYLNIMLLLVSFFSIFLGYKMTNSLTITILFFSISYSIIYIIYGIRSFQISKGDA